MANRILLSNDEWVNLPDGADPDAYRKYCEGKIRAANKPAKNPRRASTSRKASKRSFHAGSILSGDPITTPIQRKVGQAMAEQLDRINGTDQDSQDQDNQDEMRVILVGRPW